MTHLIFIKNITNKSFISGRLIFSKCILLAKWFSKALDFAKLDSRVIEQLHIWQIEIENSS